MVRFFTFQQFHNKRGVGSTKIRVENLLKYWDDAELYKYGENPDTMIFQKVYVTQDYKFPVHFKGIKILDICDADWLDGTLIKQTVDAMDAVVTPTEPLAQFLRQLTDKPVRVIKDRFDIEEFPKIKTHEGDLKKLVWFGYSHNAETLKGAMVSIARRNLELIVISDNDPQCWHWAQNNKYKDLYTFYKFNQRNLYKQLQEADVAVFPQGWRPVDKYKSENKTVIAQLCGLPVIKTADEMDQLQQPDKRNQIAKLVYNKVTKEYDARKSVAEYQELIEELKANR